MANRTRTIFRKALIIALLKESQLSVKEIAQKASCSISYVYHLRSKINSPAPAVKPVSEPVQFELAFDDEPKRTLPAWSFWVGAAVCAVSVAYFLFA